MKPYISVILPCYNVAEFLPVCMASLESQTIGINNLELIFVDDASTDAGETWQKILEFEQKHPENVIAIRLEENRCQGGARNVGLEYASADYIGYIDPDDWIDPNMYLSLYMKAIQYQCDVVDCRSIMAYPDGRQYVRHAVEDSFVKKERAIIDGGNHWIDAFISVDYGGGIVTGIYKKELLQRCGITFPERLRYEDNYWQSVLLLYVRSYYRLKDDFYFYRQNENSTVHGRNQEYHFDRLEVEKYKLNAYKESGVFERFKTDIEWEFLGLYYINTLVLIWSRFDILPYDRFCKMQEEIKELFPNYKNNPHILPGSVNADMIDLIDRTLTYEEFFEAGKRIIQRMINGKK